MGNVGHSLSTLGNAHRAEARPKYPDPNLVGGYTFSPILATFYSHRMRNLSIVLSYAVI